MSSQTVFPVIVIYRINISESECYNSFLSKIPLDEFLVYDNSPSDFIPDMDSLPTNAIYIRDEENKGLSVAYNTAADYAENKGYNRILLLDQDTLFPVSMYHLLCESKAAVCAPIVRLKNGNPFSPTVWRHAVVRGAALSPGEYPLSKYLLINSGLCVQIQMFRQSGGYNENIRLDFADFQFMHRLRKVVDSFELLDCTAIQDFSNYETNVDKLYTRFGHYLEGARNFETDSLVVRLKIKWMVLLHTVSLTKRTKSLCFLRLLLSK